MDFWSGVPSDMISRIHFFNVAAEIDINSDRSPVGLLKRKCSVQDFCVIKIDVDTAEVELAWIDQILLDSDLSSKIDELFWEHHVCNSAMGASS